MIILPALIFDCKNMNRNPMCPCAFSGRRKDLLRSRNLNPPWGLFLVCAAAIFLCGCFSRPEPPPFHAGDERPPDFLVGPIAAVLTNLNGFSAHVVATVDSPDGRGETKTGDLLERGGRLIYQPTLIMKGKRARTAGDLFFIWDERNHNGYVLSDALQAYAPIKLALTTPNLGVESKSEKGGAEQINGFACHRCTVVVPLQNGLKINLTLWQADGFSGFPTRIECSNGHDTMTLNFTEIRLASPPEELFMPPNGFKAYASSASLMTELLARDSTLYERAHAPVLDDPGESHGGNWHPMPAGQPIIQ